MRWLASLALFFFRTLRFWPWRRQRSRWQLFCIEAALDAYTYEALDEHICAAMPAYIQLHAHVHGPKPELGASASLVHRLATFGRILVQAGHEARGEELLQGAVLFFTDNSPPHLTRRWAASVLNLGVAYLELGRMQDALPWLEEALAMRTMLHGGDSFEVAQCHNNLGFCLNRLGRFDEAERAIEVAIRLHTRHCGARSRDVAGANCNLAENRLRRGQAIDALPLLQGAIEATARYDSIRSDLLDSLSDVYAALGRLQECRLAADRSIQTAFRDGRIAKVIEYARKLTERLESAGRNEEASQYRALADSMQRKHYFQKAKQEGLA